MFGKNNQKMAQFRHADQRQRFAVRKLGIGVVSVLVGVALAGGVVVTDAAADTTETTVSAPAAGLATMVTTAAASDASSSAATSTAALAGVNKAAAPAQVMATSNDAGDVTTSVVGSTATTSPAQTTSAPTQAAPVSNAVVLRTSQPTAAAPTSAYQDFTPATPEVNATTTPTEVTDQQGSVLSVDKNTIGADGTNAGITITFKTVTRKNDIYTITVPNSTIYKVTNGGDGDLKGLGLGTRTVKNLGTATVITYKFEAEASISPHIVLERGQNGGLNVMGDYQRVIRWSLTRAGQDPIENAPLVIWQMVHPSINPSEVGVADPEPWRGITRWLPNTDYVYGFQINQNPNGFNGWTWPGIDQDVNAGTTITIPVPTGFVLNEEWTQAKNNFTITQPGGMSHDVIITVPAGKGNAGSSFKLVGKVVGDRPATDELISASTNPLASNGGQAQVVETVLTPTGTTTLTATMAPWQVTLAGQQSPLDQGQPLVKSYGNNSANQFLLDHDDSNNPAIVNWFTFTNKTPIAFDGQMPLNLYLHLADGLHVTGIKTPVDPVNLPGTTSYRYVITHPDQSKEEGSVAAGAVIQDTSGKGIRDLQLIPNQLVPTASTVASVNPDGDYGPTKQNNAVVALIAYGSLVATYDNGTPLKRGDQLVSSITAQSPGFNQGKYYTAQDIQTLISEADLRALYGVNGYQFPNTGQTPGTEDAGILTVSLNKNGSTTDQVFEPTLYFVLPEGTTLKPTADWNTAKVTTTRVNGQEVVKVDYAGTGQYFANGELHLTNLNNALPGIRNWQVYMVSPNTPLKNNPASLTAAQRQALGITDETVYSIGEGNWTIAVPAAFYTPGTSQGNLDQTDVNAGRSDDKGSPTMKYYLSAFNYANSALSNPRLLVNLPEATADHFTFNLTGPVSFLGQAGVSDADVQIYYSTQHQAIPTEKGSQVSLAGYVTADQIAPADWAKIRSLVIVLPTVTANSQIGQFVLTGEDQRVTWDAKKSGPLEAVMTVDGMLPFQANPTSITIQGTATVTARYHYVDAAGEEHFIDLPMLTKTYQDNVDTMQQTDFTLTDAARALIPANYELATAVPTIVNGAQSWVTTAVNETAAFGQTVRYYFDGDIVQFELVHQHRQTPKTITKTVNYYYDTVGGRVAHAPLVKTVTITADQDLVTGEQTYLIDGQVVPNQGATTLAGQALPGIAGYTAHVVDDRIADVTGATAVDYQSDDLTLNVVYTANKQTATFIYHDDVTGEDLLTVPKTGLSDQAIGYTTGQQVKDYQAQGYWLVSDETNGQAVTFDHDDDKDQVYYIHLNHQTVPATDTKQVTQTIHYVDQTGQPMQDQQGQQLPDSTQTVTLTRTGTKDVVTGKTSWQAWSTDDYAAVASPVVAGYTPDQATVAASAVTGMSEDTTITVKYTPNPQAATFIYHDDTAGRDLLTVNQTGPSDQLINYQTKDQLDQYLAAGYVLVNDETQGQAVYFDHDDQVKQTYLIRLKHDTATTTRTKQITQTIRYVDPTGQPMKDAQGQELPTNVQPVTLSQTGVKDLVTGEVVWNGSWTTGAYQSVTSPTVPGYTVDQAVVAGQAVTTSNDLVVKNQDRQVIVTYTPETRPATLRFVDVTTGQVLTSVTVSGAYGTPIDFVDKHGQDYDQLLAGYTTGTGYYQLVTGDPAYVSYGGQEVKYTLGDDTYTVYLTHQTVPATDTKQVTQTIHYVDPTGQPMQDTQGQQLSDNVQTVTLTRTGTKDLVTGAISWQAWSTGSYTAVASPVVAGYTPDQTTVAASAVDESSTDRTITVKYTPNEQSATFIYHDDTTGQILLTVGQTGASDQLINYRTKDQLDQYLAAGYLLVKDETQGQAVYFDHDDQVDQTYVIHLKHGTAPTVRTKQITQTVHYVDQMGQPMKDEQGQMLADNVQTVTLTQSGTSDLVTQTTTWDGLWTTADYTTVASPVLTGYTPSQDQVTGTAVTTSNELVAKNQDTLVVITYAPNAATVKVHYQTRDGQSVADSQNLVGKYGEGYETTAKSVSGYHLIETPANATGTYTTNTPDVIYVYAPDEETVTVHYQTADGTSLAPSETQMGSYGSDYTTSAKKIPGYHLTTTPTNATGTYTTDTPDVIYVYAPDEESVTVHYQTADGTPLALSETQTGTYGSDYTTSAKKIPGYHLTTTPTNATGTYTTDTPDVIYVYAPDEETVTVHYQTADGTTVAPSETQTGTYGSDYTTSAKEIQGYHLVKVPTNAKGTYTTDTPDVIYVYAPDEESVTVHYQTADGTPLASSETHTGSYGSDYTTSAKEISGYHLTTTPTNATGTYTTDTPDVIYVYAPDEETVTVRYQTADGTALLPSETQTGDYGSDYTTSAKKIPDYHLTTTPTNATGTYTTDTPDVIYVYAPDEETVTVHYQTADGTTVAPSETQTGTYGSDYTTSAKEITGYHLVKVPTNAKGTYTTDTPDVIYVYAPDEESVTVHYQTADGTSLAPSETLRGEYGSTYTTQAKEINGYRLVAIPANATGTYTTNTPDVIYVYVPIHKGEINEPTDPGTPITPSPDQLAPSPGTPAEPLPPTPAPAGGPVTSGATPVVQSPAVRASHPAAPSAARLPQTGNDAAAADWQAALGSLLGSLSLLALAKRKRE